jgi:hypothetical protein
MFRVIIGAVPAGLAMFVLGFIFFASGLQNIAIGSLPDAQAAAVRQALAANLTTEGTGTYLIPNRDSSPEQASMYGDGPVATVHYNTKGFANNDSGSLIGGLVLNLIVALLIGAALIGIDRRVPDFGTRARVVGILAVAASALMHLKEPLFYHHDWPHFIYLFLADAVTLTVGGVIIARWFLPKGVSAVDDTHEHQSPPA